MKHIILFDNYDSFTHNLLHLLQRVRPQFHFTVIRNQDRNVLKMTPDAFVVGPGPMTPAETGLLGEYFDKTIEPSRIPVLGVCLGMQYLGYRENVTVKRATEPAHGAAVRVHHTKKDIFENVDENFHGARYNSLEIQCADIENHSNLQILAIEKATNAVMALRNNHFPWAGVQFHPESFLTTNGELIVNNFFNQYVEHKIQ